MLGLDDRELDQIAVAGEEDLSSILTPAGEGVVKMTANPLVATLYPVRELSDRPRESGTDETIKV